MMILHVERDIDNYIALAKACAVQKNVQKCTAARVRGKGKYLCQIIRAKSLYQVRSVYFESHSLKTSEKVRHRSVNISTFFP